MVIGQYNAGPFGQRYSQYQYQDNMRYGLRPISVMKQTLSDRSIHSCCRAKPPNLPHNYCIINLLSSKFPIRKRYKVGFKISRNDTFGNQNLPRTQSAPDNREPPERRRLIWARSFTSIYMRRDGQANLSYRQHARVPTLK